MVRTALLVALTAFACSSQPQKKHDDSGVTGNQAVAASPTVAIPTDIGEVTVAVEVVATPPLIEKGLMFREFLAPDAGMLFLMGKDYEWTFWMKNTLIPLDMIFITKDLTIAGVVENAVPRTETPRRVDGESRYVLEVNGGWTARHGVKPGTRVRFVGVSGT